MGEGVLRIRTVARRSRQVEVMKEILATSAIAEKFATQGVAPGKLAGSDFTRFMEAERSCGRGRYVVACCTLTAYRLWTGSVQRSTQGLQAVHDDLGKKIGIAFGQAILLVL
jgi:hypothetical protein